MADYFHHRAPAAQARNDSPGYRVVAIGGLLLAVLAAAMWLWMRQPVRDTALPSSEPVAESVAEAPPIQPLAARPVTPPTSSDLAAVGDTRAAR
jgi:hypothetical protein